MLYLNILTSINLNLCCILDRIERKEKAALKLKLCIPLIGLSNLMNLDMVFSSHADIHIKSILL
jgi:hypothetical protein